MFNKLLTLLLALLPLSTLAESEGVATPRKIADNLYAMVGSTGPRTYENYGLNANIGFAVTDNGVLLIDSGATFASGPLIEKAVASITPKPIRWVINTGSQDHRWLGNGYFGSKGAEIIALARTVTTQTQFAEQQLSGLKNILKERLADTVPVTASRVIDKDNASLSLGGMALEIHFFGDAHYPGDATIWFPQQKVLFSGDLIYVDRMLGILPWSKPRSWSEAFHNMESLQPAVIVPGHGAVCDLAKAKQDTGNYLDWLMSEVGKSIEEWEPLADTVNRLADAEEFQHLQHYDSWHRTNINRTYLSLEAGN